MDEVLSGEGGTRGEFPASPRILIYSHDTFGLGHLRRSRAIANRLAQSMPSASILIISGSPVVGSFEYAPGVDFIRMPGVVKLGDGNYTTQSLNLTLDETVRLRASLIRETAETFRPHLFIVDKEPTGFRGEIMAALPTLRRQGTHIVLGVRDVLDDPDVLGPEWDRKGAVEALALYYESVWVYGLREIYEPLAGLHLPAAIDERVVYTGYIRRDLPIMTRLVPHPNLPSRPFLLVTAGGGGDGEGLIDWVLAAYEADPALTVPAVIVFGPFVPRDLRSRFHDRAAKLPNIHALSFDAKIEHLMVRASAIVSMGGYNTFCEILSFGKRALIVPRTTPRLEQAIRAERAAELGLVRVLDGANLDNPGGRDPHVMAGAIRRLMDEAPAPRAALPGLLDGLTRIDDLASRAILSAAQRSMPAMTR